MVIQIKPTPSPSVNRAPNSLWNVWLLLIYIYGHDLGFCPLSFRFLKAGYISSVFLVFVRVKTNDTTNLLFHEAGISLYRAGLHLSIDAIKHCKTSQYLSFYTIVRRNSCLFHFVYVDNITIFSPSHHLTTVQKNERKMVSERPI